jgi:outer membrane lipoprotein-sorting protein
MTSRLRRLHAFTTALLAAAALAVLVGGGCTQRHTRPTDAPTEPGPILARLAERAAAVRSLSGMLSLEVWRGDERVRLRQLLLVVRPDKVRVDTLSPFDQPLAMMASDGQTLTIYSLENKRYEQGPATTVNLSRLLRLPLSGDELTAVLAGGVPIPAGITPTLSWDAETGTHVLEFVDGRRRQRVSLEPVAWRLVELRAWDGDAPRYVARFGDFDGEGLTAVPRRMRFEVPAESLRVDARFEDFTLNVAPPADAFTIPPPRGISVDPL